MPIEVFCQQCGKPYLARDEQAGAQVYCPVGHIIQVPAAAGGMPVLYEAAPSGAGAANPYLSPVHGSPLPTVVGGRPKGKVWAPAIALIVVGVLGFCFSILSVVMASVGEPPAPNPNLPPMFEELAQSSHGPLAAAIQAGFILLNLCIIGGAVQMMRFKTWGFGLAATILAMVNFGNCCCVLGIPVGIWSLVILLQNDVRAAFQQSS